MPLVLYDVDRGVFMEPMQGKLASSRGEGEVSWIFSSCGKHVGYILEFDGDAHSKWEFV